MVKKVEIMEIKWQLMKKKSEYDSFLIAQKLSRIDEITSVVSYYVRRFYNYYGMQEIASAYNNVSEKDFHQEAIKTVLAYIEEMSDDIFELDNQNFHKVFLSRIGIAAQEGCRNFAENLFGSITELSGYYLSVLAKTKKAGFLGYINNYDPEMVASYSHVSYKAVKLLQDAFEKTETTDLVMNKIVRSVILDFCPMLPENQQDFFLVWFSQNGLSDYNLSQLFDMSITEVSNLKMEQTVRMRAYLRRFKYAMLEPKEVFIPVKYREGYVEKKHSCAEKKGYTYQKKGYGNGRKILSNRVGQVNIHKKTGQKMTILKYANCFDIDVIFEDGTIVNHTHYSAFSKGTLKYPKKIA